MLDGGQVRASSTRGPPTLLVAGALGGGRGGGLGGRGFRGGRRRDRFGRGGRFHGRRRSGERRGGRGGGGNQQRERSAAQGAQRARGVGGGDAGERAEGEHRERQHGGRARAGQSAARTPGGGSRDRVPPCPTGGTPCPTASGPPLLPRPPARAQVDEDALQRRRARPAAGAAAQAVALVGGQRRAALRAGARSPPTHPAHPLWVSIFHSYRSLWVSIEVSVPLYTESI